MGRIRTKTVKRASKVLIEKYYSKLTADFHFNKKVLSDVGVLPSKRMRNKIAGFATHLMKRIQRGPIRGISLKVQEEERERRLDYIPEQSKININRVAVTADTKEMLKKIGMGNLPNIVVEGARQQDRRHQRKERPERPHKKQE
jgi:small subunit ribosomal protein S17e